jgi:hypothetical protein
MGTFLQPSSISLPFSSQRSLGSWTSQITHSKGLQKGTTCGTPNVYLEFHVTPRIGPALGTTAPSCHPSIQSSMAPHTTLRVEDGVAVIELHNPPVNALHPAGEQGLALRWS